MSYMKDTASSERREFIRYCVKEHAITVLGPKEMGVGEVEDISFNGISFRYLDRGMSLLHKKKISCTLFDNDDFCCDNLPCTRITEKQSSSTGNSAIRHCRAEFGDLSPHQISKIEYLIIKHTGPTPPGE